jgi:dTDP-4-dehydrorhamnose 3,5-epimerase
MINGVVIRELVTHDDERGCFRELMRATDDMCADGLRQWSHSMMHKGVLKAWHIHQKQTDYWYVPVGLLKVAMHDLRAGSSSRGETMELLMGDGRAAVVLKIPPGVAHGCRVLSKVAHLLYVTSRTYDPADEGRIPHDDPRIGYNWLAQQRTRVKQR